SVPTTRDRRFKNEMPPADQVGGLVLQIDLNGRLRVYGSDSAEHDRQFEDPPHKNRNLPETKKFQTSRPCSAERRPLRPWFAAAAHRVTNLRDFPFRSAVGPRPDAAGSPRTSPSGWRTGSPRRPRPTGAGY